MTSFWRNDDVIITSCVQGAGEVALYRLWSYSNRDVLVMCSRGIRAELSPANVIREVEPSTSVLIDVCKYEWSTTPPWHPDRSHPHRALTHDNNNDIDHSTNYYT